MMFNCRLILPRCKRALNGISKTELVYAKSFRNRNSLTGQHDQCASLLGQWNRFYATESKSNDDSPKLQRIYYGSLAPRMKAVKVFSLTTSCAGLAAQPILMEQGMKLGGTGMAIFLCGFAGFFTFVTPFLLHFVTKKYVTEMHYNPATGEYTATTISLFLKKIETKFRPNDVKVPEVPGMFTSFFVGKKPMFVDPALFENTDHYVRIMGYDKPIDFKLDLKDSSSTPEAIPKADEERGKK